MIKIFISLIFIASVGGMAATFADTAKPGSFLYAFKTHISDTVAAALCSFDLPCAQ